MTSPTTIALRHGPAVVTRRTTPPAAGFRLRRARLEDLAALARLEQRSFAADRLSRRSYRRLLDRDSAFVALAEQGGLVRGAVVVLFRRSTAIARLYSLAVSPEARGTGIGSTLLAAAAAASLGRGCALLRLEVRPDNAPARRLYQRLGFATVGRMAGYYADGADALRMERSLWADAVQARRRFPYYRQTLDFTCGPAALMMAMGAMSPDVPLDRVLEIRLWREATTVFMTSGHGGCGPYGLALAAHRRGFGVAVHAPASAGMFLDGVRDPDKKRVISLVEADFMDELSGTSVVVRHEQVTARTLESHLRRGHIPLVLISLYRLHGEKGPHWVTVTDFDGRVFRVLDPMSPPDHGRLPEISIARHEFERMSRYGRRRQTAAIFITGRERT